MRIAISVLGNIADSISGIRNIVVLFDKAGFQEIYWTFLLTAQEINSNIELLFQLIPSANVAIMNRELLNNLIIQQSGRAICLVSPNTLKSIVDVVLEVAPRQIRIINFADNSTAEQISNILNMHTDNGNMLIATSLSPKNIELQKRALASWSQCGFRFASLNCAEEIAALAAVYPETEFYLLQREAKSTWGKPYPYFDDVIEFFRKNDCEICGIVNSDIFFKEPKLKAFIQNEARDAFVFGSRVDVENININQGNMYDFGFDYFFFDRKFLELFPKEDFCLGLPWWDFWIVMVMLKNNISVKRLMTPVAFHEVHSINWQSEPWLYFGHVMAKYFQPPYVVSPDSMKQYLQLVARTIHGKAKNIFL